MTVNDVSVSKQQDAEKMNKQGNMFTVSSFRPSLRKFALRMNSFNLSFNSIKQVIKS